MGTLAALTREDPWVLFPVCEPTIWELYKSRHARE